MSSSQRLISSLPEAEIAKIIELQKQLPAGWAINHISEIEEVITEAIDEAVKIVVLEKEPEIAYWKKSAELWQKEAKSAKAKTALTWGGAGLVVGFVAGILIIK